MHPTEGELRAYLDEALNPAQLQDLQAHLASCAQCQVQVEDLQNQAQRVSIRLQALSPTTAGPRRTPMQARAYLEARTKIEEKEHVTMLNKLFSRLPRPAWAALTIITLLTASLAFPPAQAIANSFLGLFRVQKIAVVSVNPGNLPEELGSSTQFEAMFNKDVQMGEQGDPQPAADAAEASQLAGFAVRLPDAQEGTPDLKVVPGNKATLKIDLAQVRAVLSEIGRGDIQLPDNLDGAQIDVEVPTSVVAKFGKCKFDPQAAREAGYDPDEPQAAPLLNCTQLVQMPSPTVSAPAGLDITQIGEAFLQVMGMDRDEAAHFAQTVDWTSTFVVPIPKYGAEYKDVTVDGVQGTLIRQRSDRAYGEYMLLWVKDGMVYAQAGRGDDQSALDMANSMR